MISILYGIDNDSYLIWLPFTSGDKDVEGWKGTDDDLAILGVDDRTFSFYADYLLGVGVVVRIPRFHMGDNDGGLYYTNEYYVTQYGLEFVEYVKDQAWLKMSVSV